MGLGTPDEQATFLKEVVPWLEEQNFVERYAAFGESVAPCSSAVASVFHPET